MSASALFLVAMSCLFFARAAPLATVQNSNLSVPSANLVSAGLPGATNLSGSNFLLSSVMPDTLHGGYAFLRNSQQWMQAYAFPTTFQDGAAYAIVIRPDGSVVVSGPSNGTGSDADFATVCYASNGTPLWTNRYDGPGHGSDTAGFLAVDPNGNVWAAGESMRYATNSTLTDVVTIKYASNGVPVWTNFYNSFETNGAYATALVVDGGGNAYVKISAAYWVGNSGTPIEQAIIKYDALGNLVWIKHYFASAPDSGQDLHGIRSMALDNSGNLIVAGEAGRNHFSTGGAVVKFTGDGTAIQTNQFSLQVISDLDLLSLDREGNAIISGSRWSSNATLYVSIKFTQEGGILWTNELPGPLYNGGNVPQTVIDPLGNAFLIGGTPGTSPGLYQILKISSDGIPLWTNLNANFGTNSMIQGSEVDNAGNLYLTGVAPAANGQPDWVTMKFSGDGLLIWSNRFDGAANREDIPFALAVGRAGEVYVAGRSETQNGKRGFATVKYADSLFYSPPRDFAGLDTITCALIDHLGHSATGTVDILVMPGAFQLGLSPTTTRMTPGGMLLQVEGVPGTNAVVLEASLDAVFWQRILTNAPNQGSVQFLDPSASNLIKRFYRVFQEIAEVLFPFGEWIIVCENNGCYLSGCNRRNMVTRLLRKNLNLCQNIETCPERRRSFVVVLKLR